MESPHKKRKIASQESQASKVTSTPQRETGNYGGDSPSVSRIGETSSSSPTDSPIINAQRSLDFSKSKPDGNAVVSDRSSWEDVIERNYSIAEDSEVADEEGLDYDEFFNKLARFPRKGQVWNLFKPIGKDEGSLYHVILNEPREAAERATWFVTYCRNVTKHGAVYLLYKFCLDCAGYQKTNVKKYFTDPLPELSKLVGDIMNKVDDEKCNAEVFQTGKFLFADNKSRMAMILQKAIYNFLQKFVLEAHHHKLLYDEVFMRLLKFLEVMCQASYRQLFYTGVILMLKLLTAICMVKSSIPDSTLGGRQDLMLDQYINTLYTNIAKACLMADSECASLKLACINELKMWIHYSAKVFVDHYNCVSMLAKLVLDQANTVRLAALEVFQKLVQNEHLVAYLQATPIELIFDKVNGRFHDVDIKIALKALEVYASMITHHYAIIQRKKRLDVLVEMIYHKDYRMGSAACKCILLISKQDQTDEQKLLLDLCKLAQNFRPTLKPLLVESSMDNTDVLQRWSLIVSIFASRDCKDIPIKIRETLSEIFLESVHQVLTGGTTKVRPYSRRVEKVDSTHHKLIADEIYPYLKAILLSHSKEPVIARNILKIVTKIKPEYLEKENIEAAGKFLLYLTKFFIAWTDTELLTALLDFLVFLNDRVPRLSTTTRNTIEDLKKYVSEELYKSFKSRDSHTILIAKKTAIVFSKFDLNENVEWSKLLVSWDIIESNVEYLENMMKCCHWSLIWKIRKLSSAHYTKSDQNKEITSLTAMSKAFFSNCWELMGHQERDVKFKAFERICETYKAFCTELENISKQIRTLEDLKPSVKDESLQKQLTDIFELSVGKCEDSIAQKYAMYIVDMAFLTVLPMECISVIFKYYDKNCDTYGKLIETVMSLILNKNDNWIPMLLLNAICICYEKYVAKHGALEVRTQEAKDILSLSRKFAECKIVKNPKIASRLLFYAVNYAVDKTAYDLLILVRVFINELQNNPDRRKEILEHLKKKVPKSHTKSDPVLYFGEHLAIAEPKKTKPAEKKGKKGRPPKVPNAPKLQITTTKVKRAPKGKENVVPRNPNPPTTESEVSDRLSNVSINDTASDDWNVNIPDLNISDPVGVL